MINIYCLSINIYYVCIVIPKMHNYEDHYKANTEDIVCPFVDHIRWRMRRGRRLYLQCLFYAGNKSRRCEVLPTGHRSLRSLQIRSGVFFGRDDPYEYGSGLKGLVILPDHKDTAR